MRQDQGCALVPNKVINDVHDATGVDQRTIRRVINGQPVRPRGAAKVQRELASRGYPFGDVNAAVSESVPLWSKRIKMPAPRKMRPESAARPQSLGPGGLSLAEREELEVIEKELADGGGSRVRPRTLSECPPDGSPCPWVSCKHHLAIDVLQNVSGLREGHERRAAEVVKLNWPGRDVDELEETCSLRVAARAGRKKPTTALRTKGIRSLPVLSCEEVSRLMNSTAERVRQIERVALAKLEAIAAELDPA